SRQDHSHEINTRLESIEVNQLTSLTAPSYTSAIVKSTTAPKPPTKKEMTLACPGQTISHSKTGTHPLKELDYKR
ncbi:hypothetical protein VP01_11366g1, partial [Puccinia sorghi]